MRSFSFILLLIALGSCADKKENAQNKETSIPVKKDNLFSFTAKNIYFEVDSTTGGRIASLKLGGQELLYLNKDSNSNNWGSTFWPSPQSIWGWPPPAVLDNYPYKSFIKNDTLVLLSEIAFLPKISVGKNFSVSAEDTSISIVYTIYNPGDTMIKVAPWEITRVPAGGLFVFPKGNDQARGALQPLTRDSAGAVWFNYDSSTIPSGIPKLFADGAEGWIAYVNNSRQIIIKQFPDSDTTMKAPDPEDEIEIYTNPDKSYVEMEQQGPYTNVAPKGILSWTVKWYAREIPAGIDLRVGSPSLLAYIRNVIAKNE